MIMSRQEQERLDRFVIAAMQGLCARETINTAYIPIEAVQIAKRTMKAIADDEVRSRNIAKSLNNK